MNFMPHRRSVVLCPKVKLPAAVGVDNALSIEACSRSPRLQDCNQDCLSQLRFSAEELEGFLTSHAQEWCSICGTMLTSDDWYASRTAAVSATTTGSDAGCWRAIGEDGQNICWNCYTADPGKRRAA